MNRGLKKKHCGFATVDANRLKKTWHVMSWSHVMTWDFLGNIDFHIAQEVQSQSKLDDYHPPGYTDKVFRVCQQHKKRETMVMGTLEWIVAANQNAEGEQKQEKCRQPACERLFCNFVFKNMYICILHVFVLWGTFSCLKSATTIVQLIGWLIKTVQQRRKLLVLTVKLSYY